MLIWVTVLQSVKNLIPCPSSIIIGLQQEIETLECPGVIRKSISPWASPIVVVPKKSTQGEPPHRRMCIDFRKLNDLQPEVCCADSQTGGNISLVPLPKINKMYGRLKGAKYFTTLD